jgi:hypothetical protein
MKIADAWEAYYAHTGKASDVARQLSLAGLALIWLFHSDKKAEQVTILAALQPSTLLFIIALALDLLQYTVASLIWGCWTTHTERRLKGPRSNPDILAPKYINVPIGVLFLLKLCVVFWGYGGLLQFLWNAWI